MLGTAPTVTHALPAWSIPDIRHTVPTPYISSPVSPHPEITHYLPPLPHLPTRKPVHAPVPTAPTRERAEWCPPVHLV